MLFAKKMAQALERLGVKVVSYEESRDLKFMDGEVIIENSLSVQVGNDYACLCVVEDDDIEYLLEEENVTKEEDFARQVAQVIKQRY
jgi:hypothetical protein